MPKTTPSLNVPHTVRWSLPWITGKKAVRPEFLDALIRWSPAKSPVHQSVRKPVNLAIVIDRSGSMDDPLTKQNLSSRFLGHPVRATPAQPWVDPSAPFAPWITPDPAPQQPDPWKWGQPVWMQAVAQSNASPSLQAVDQAAALQRLNDLHQTQQVAPERAKTKLDLTLEAAWAAVQNLEAGDRVSIVSFDDHVKVVCSGVDGADKAKLRRALDSIVTGSTTALFDGWAAGAREVAQGMSAEFLNRVILLTDGRANEGERNADKIAMRLAELADTGVSTSVFGMGLDYDEDLLQAMAQAGDGNYYYIQGNDDFLALFEDEFQGIANVVGKKVRLSIDAQDWAAPVDVLNEFPLDAEGWSKLPTLMAGKDLNVVLRLKPSTQPGSLTLRLRFENRAGTVMEQTIQVVVPTSKTAGTPDQAVVDEVAQLLVAREKKKAIAALDLGDVQTATNTMRQAHAFMSNASSAVSAQSFQDLTMLADGMDAGDVAGMRKSALYQTYNVRSGKSR